MKKDETNIEIWPRPRPSLGGIDRGHAELRREHRRPAAVMPTTPSGEVR
jgi:hypothetical protein